MAYPLPCPLLGNVALGSNVTSVIRPQPRDCHSPRSARRSTQLRGGATHEGASRHPHRYNIDRLHVTAPSSPPASCASSKITLVEEHSGSPTRVVLTDRFLLGAVAGWIAVFGRLSDG